MTVTPETPEEKTSVHEQHKQHELSSKTRSDIHNHQHVSNVANSYFSFSSYQIKCSTEYVFRRDGSDVIIYENLSNKTVFH
jgi:hypothetical protein